MTKYDQMLEDMGLKYEDLNVVERETYKQAVFSMQALTIGDLKNYISEMKNAIALQVSDVPDTPEQSDLNSKLKARLKTYILLESFLTTPDKAEKALKSALQNLKKN